MPVITFQDEFGGYSSRLRNVGDEDEGLENNLCKLLGIDIDKIALKVAMQDFPSRNKSNEYYSTQDSN